MGGMKTGAGEDPFADDQDDDEEDDGGQQRGETGGTAFGDATDSESERLRDQEPDPPGGDDGGDDKLAARELPFIARRNARGDNVKAGRETRRLFELRPEVAGEESAFMDDLESELGTDVPKTDAREAALAVVYERPELVAARLEEWGINYFEGE